MKNIKRVLLSISCIVMFVACSKSKEEHVKDLEVKTARFKEKLVKAMPKEANDEIVKALKKLGISDEEAAEFSSDQLGNLFESHLKKIKEAAEKNCNENDLYYINYMFDSVDKFVDDMIALSNDLWSLAESEGLKDAFQNTVDDAVTKAEANGHKAKLTTFVKAFLKNPDPELLEHQLEGIDTTEYVTIFKQFTKNNKEILAKFEIKAMNLVKPVFERHESQIKSLKSSLNSISEQCGMGMISELGGMGIPVGMRMPAPGMGGGMSKPTKGQGRQHHHDHSDHKGHNHSHKIKSK